MMHLASRNNVILLALILLSFILVGRVAYNSLMPNLPGLGKMDAMISKLAILEASNDELQVRLQKSLEFLETRNAQPEALLRNPVGSKSDFLKKIYSRFDNMENRLKRIAEAAPQASTTAHEKEGVDAPPAPTPPQLSVQSPIAVNPPPSPPAVGPLSPSGALFARLDDANKSSSRRRLGRLSPPLALSAYVDPKSTAPRVAATGDRPPNTTSPLSTIPSQCCYSTSLDALDKKFTSQFFDAERKSPSVKWSGKEEEEWQVIRSKFKAKNESDFCEVQWKYTVLNEAAGFYLRIGMDHILKKGVTVDNQSFRYLRPSDFPRILVLGDSISRGTWVEIQNIVESKNIPLSVQGAPTNCGGFSDYVKDLPRWLGDCPWDLVQFNVGMHFHGTMIEYRQKLVGIVKKILEHSPKSHVVFALTTPSPFDSNETFPDKATCKNYDKFHKEGFIAKLNMASTTFSELNITINDRYSAVHQHLKVYQLPCDVHYSKEGYEQLAKQDLKVFSKLLLGT